MILSDIGLPGISGIEFTQQLRVFEKTQNKASVPIVALTGHAEGKMRDECIAAGMNDVIIKPLRPETVADICNKFALFGDNLPVISTTPQPSNKPSTSALGVDLPNTEDELFQIEPFLIFDIDGARKVLGDDSTLLMNMLKLTVNTIPDELPHLKTAHQTSDWEKVAKIAHKLKGGFLSRTHPCCHGVPISRTLSQSWTQ